MQKQKKIEDEINKTLTGEKQRKVLDFVDFLKMNDFSLIWDGDWWGVQYKGSYPALLGVDNNGVNILFNYCDFACNNIIDNDLKIIAWEHIHRCVHFESGGKQCGCGEQPGKSITLFGKTINNTCQCPLQFWSSDAKTLENIKKLMLMQKNSVDTQCQV